MNLILKATNKQLEDRVKALETWRVAIAIDAFKTATTNSLATLASRVSALEAGGGSDPVLVDLVASLATAVAVLQATVCPQTGVIDGLTADVGVLKADHVPD